MNALAKTLNKQAVVRGFQELPVRTAHMESWFFGPGRLGSTTPTRRAWAEGQPQELGRRIGDLLAEDDVLLRVFAADGNHHAIHRRTQSTGRFTGNVHTELKGGGPIHGAEVTDITEIDVGRGRMLPLLTLMEFTPRPPAEELVVSLSDMARYIQRSQVELVLD